MMPTCCRIFQMFRSPPSYTYCSRERGPSSRSNRNRVPVDDADIYFIKLIIVTFFEFVLSSLTTATATVRVLTVRTGYRRAPGTGYSTETSAEEFHLR